MYKVLLNVCSTGKIYNELMLVLMYAKNNSKHNVTINIQKEYPISYNMNLCVDLFLQDKSYEWLAFVEQDNVPHLNFLNILDDVPEHINIVSGWYNTIRTKEEAKETDTQLYDEFTCMSILQDGVQHLMSPELIKKNKVGNYIACNNSGNGCIFIRRWLVEKMVETFGCCFSEDFNLKGKRGMSQDAWFGKQVYEVFGQYIWVDVRQRVYHIKEVWLWNFMK